MTQLAIMNLFVTRNTNRFSVVNSETQLWKFRPRFDMMSLQISICATPSALVAISVKNLFTPRCDARLIDFSFRCGCAAFPVPMTRSTFRGIVTFLRTELLTGISVKKCMSASLTRSWIQWCANTPTRLRTVFGKCSVWFGLKSLSANFTNALDSLATVFASYLIKAIHRAKSLIRHTRGKHLMTYLTFYLRKFFSCEIMFPKVLLICCSVHLVRGNNRLTTAAFTNIHDFIIQYTFLIVKYCAVVLQRMKDAFPEIKINKVE